MEQLTRRPSTFKKSDIVRIVSGVQAAGLDVVRLEVQRDGLIVVVTGTPGEVSNAVELDALHGATAAPDELDRELAEFNGRHDKG